MSPDSCSGHKSNSLFPTWKIRKEILLFTRRNSNTRPLNWASVSESTLARHLSSWGNFKVGVSQRVWFQSINCVWKQERKSLAGTTWPPTQVQVPSHSGGSLLVRVYFQGLAHQATHFWPLSKPHSTRHSWSILRMMKETPCWTQPGGHQAYLQAQTSGACVGQDPKDVRPGIMMGASSSIIDFPAVSFLL